MNKKRIKYRVVYAIRNAVNKKIYIGSAENFWNRIWQHKKELRKGIHSNYHLQNAWIKYGEQCFVFGVVEELTDECNIAEREQFWMNEFDVTNRSKGYNIFPNARTSLGHKHSENAKLKMSVKKKGKKWTSTQIKAMSNADRSNHHMIGKTGKSHFKSKPILRLSCMGEMIDEWESINMCALATKIHKSNIIDCLKGNIKQAFGYKFEYK